MAGKLFHDYSQCRDSEISSTKAAGGIHISDAILLGKYEINSNYACKSGGRVLTLCYP